MTETTTTPPEGGDKEITTPLQSEASTETPKQEREVNQTKVFDTLMFTEIMDSITIDISDVAGGFNEIFKKDLAKVIQQMSPQEMQKFKWLQVICAEKMQGSKPTDFEWVDIAFQSFLKDQTAEIILVSFMDPYGLCKTNTKKGPFFTYLTNQDHVRFLRLPFTPQGLADFFLQSHEPDMIQAFLGFKKMIQSTMGTIFHTMGHRIPNFDTMSIEERIHALSTVPVEQKTQREQEQELLVLKLTRLQYREELENSSDQAVREKIGKLYQKTEEEHLHFTKEAAQLKQIMQMGKYKVHIDYTQPGQKYILCRDTSENIVFYSKHVERHKHMAQRLWIEKASVYGGGRIEIDDQRKIFRTYDMSWDYRKIPEELEEILENLIASEYPGYKIIIQ